jgi:hypothetical protein
LSGIGGRGIIEPSVVPAGKPCKCLIINILQGRSRIVLVLAQPLLIRPATGAAQKSGGVVILKDTNTSKPIFRGD